MKEIEWHKRLCGLKKKNIDRILDAIHKVSVIKIKYSGLNKRKLTIR